MQAALHRRHGGRTGPTDVDAAITPPDSSIAFVPPPRYDRPTGAVNTQWTSPVTNTRAPNVQEMQSGSDELRGAGETISGGDYSREQGIGRAPGWQWPFNFNSQAFNVQSLDRWAIERTGAIALPVDSGANPYVGVPDKPYSPVATMDNYTMYYERDPDQWNWLSPGPITIQEAEAQSFTEQAVL